MASAGNWLRGFAVVVLAVALFAGSATATPAAPAPTAVAVSAFSYTTCALTSAGGVECWGYNQYGELGDGTFKDSPTPVPVSGLSSGVVALGQGSYYDCALTSAGAVKCWGENPHGQLGDGTTTNRDTPVQVTGLTSGAVAIDTDGHHACALMAPGAVECWGDNTYGELGDGTTTDRHTPVTVSGLTGSVTAIAVGGGHTCALMSSSGVECWGANFSGELGDGSTIPHVAPVAVFGLNGAVAISAGGAETCALMNSGGVKCWGDNTYGKLGNGDPTAPNSTVPVNVYGLGGVASINVGWNHTCAVTSSGGVQCWGSNSSGELGDGATTDSNTPVAVEGLGNGVIAVSAGLVHTCALRSTGGIECWGFGDAEADGLLPRIVPGFGLGAAALAAGENHTCALMWAGSVDCWGFNGSGQLGDGTTGDKHTPVPVSGLTSGVIAIAAGGNHSCAVTSVGAVECWGENGSGQLGDGTNTPRPTPVPVSGLTSGVIAVTAGLYHSCALTGAGAVECWGDNGYGQIGDGTNTPRPTPVPVSGLASGVIAIAAGGNHSCALMNTGAVMCWGDNGSGQLGDGSTMNRAHPVGVSLAGGVIPVADGADHTCVLTYTGKIDCWGNNGSGQLGDGTTGDQHTPVPVKGLASGAVTVTAGGAHTCAVTSVGAVECWGENIWGQLGDGTENEQDTPVQVSGLVTGAVAVAAGPDHTCALMLLGGIECWGLNSAGQLGDGTTTVRLTPTVVTGFQNAHLLSVSRSGSGSGRITSSPAGISCGSLCKEGFAYGSSVTLSATAATGSRFAGWAGACSGTGNCTVSLTADRTVTATFILRRRLTVTKAGTGAGNVTSSPAGIACGSTCSSQFDTGTKVTLTATAAANSRFSGWSGACSGTGTCTLTLTGDLTAAATFAAIPICVVPKVIGKPLRKAKTRIRRADCRVGKIRYRYSTKRQRNRVLAQRPKAGRHLAAGAPVRLTVGRGPKKR